MFSKRRVTLQFKHHGLRDYPVLTLKYKIKLYPNTLKEQYFTKFEIIIYYVHAVKQNY